MNAILSRLADAEAALADVRRMLAEAAPPVPEAPAAPVETPPVQIAWGAKVSPELKARVILTGQDFDIDPSWIMACMAFETGRTFSPKIKNKASGATGLIQFMPKTARDEFGTTTAKLASMTAEKQFDYVWLYFRNRIRERGPLTRLSDCYMAILNPSAIGKPDSEALWVRGSTAYAQNAGLDANRDHKITKAEAAAKVHAALAEGMQQGNIG